MSRRIRKEKWSRVKEKKGEDEEEKEEKKKKREVGHRPLRSVGFYNRPL